MSRGAGFCPAGCSPAGYGTPDVIGPPNTVILPDPVTGLPQTGRFIDPVTKDYVMTADGRLQGMPTVRQLVQLVVQTTFGSSAMPSLGIDFSSVREKGDGFLQRVTAVLTNAMAPIVSQGLVRVDNVTVLNTTNPDGVNAYMNWTDLTTGQPQATPLF